jgi:hypothetical protein
MMRAAAHQIGPDYRLGRPQKPVFKDFSKKNAIFLKFFRRPFRTVPA